MFFLLSFLYILSSLLILVTTAKFFVDTQSDKHTQAIKQEVELVRFKIESNLYRDAYLADSLATLITLAPDFALSNWKSVAGRLHNNSETIVTIGLSPDDIIKRIYPEKNNTSALELGQLPRCGTTSKHEVKSANRFSCICGVKSINWLHSCR
ncbi:hypothetical protein CNR26_18245 [Vibrio parahaemolyticus]|nr:hypothetical protein CNR26_18245 [Vibrio parahaemolyticus]